MALKRLAKDFGLYVLCVGVFIHLAGFLLIADGSRVTTLLNLALFLPALALTLVVPTYRARLFCADYLFVALFLAFTVLIAAVNPASEHSIKDQLKTALYVLLYLSALAILVQENKLERLLNVAFFVAASVAVASLIYQGLVLGNPLFFSGFRLFRLGYGHYADFVNPIVSALYYGAFAVYGAHQLLSKPMGLAARLGWALATAVLGLYVLSTDSRGVWLGMLVAFVGSVVMYLESKWRNRVLIALALLVAAGVFMLKVIWSAGGRGLSMRDQIWSGWFERLGEFWLLGGGAGTDFNICLGSGSCFKQAHNLFLQTGYEFGLLGAVLLLLVIVVAFVRGVDRTLWQRPLGSVGLPLLAYASVTALVDYHTVLNRPGVYWLVFWLPMGLLIATRYSAVRGKKEDVNVVQFST